jgi:hypothetical protein
LPGCAASCRRRPIRPRFASALRCTSLRHSRRPSRCR